MKPYQTGPIRYVAALLHRDSRRQRYCGIYDNNTGAFASFMDAAHRDETILLIRSNPGRASRLVWMTEPIGVLEFL